MGNNFVISVLHKVQDFPASVGFFHEIATKFPKAQLAQNFTLTVSFYVIVITVYE